MRVFGSDTYALLLLFGLKKRFFNVFHVLPNVYFITSIEVTLDGAGSSVFGQRELCLFRTEFVNSSTLPQYFTFKTERTTTSRCDISLQRGFRIGATVDVRIALPVVSILVSVSLSVCLSVRRRY